MNSSSSPNETNDTNINTSVNVHNNKKTIITEKEITNSFVSSLQKERSAETDLSFNLFYENLNDMFLKRKYRKIVYEITQKEKTFSKSNVINSIQLLHLKLNSAFQIVNKKLIKYSKNVVPKGVDNWLNIIDTQIDVLSSKIQLLPKVNQIDQYEILTFYHLSTYYYYAMYCRQTKRITDALNYLCLCEKIINSVCHHITYTETINIIQKIYLFISSQLIVDEDFALAKSYLVKVVRLCMKELEIEKSCFKGMNNVNSTELFYHISIAFYQLGVCFENEKNIDTADDCYAQAKWFAFSFLTNRSLRYVRFIKELSKRAYNYYNISLAMKNFILNVDDKDFEEKKPIAKGVYNGESWRKVKIEKITQFVENLNIKEIDYDDQELFNEVGKKPKTKMMHTMMCELDLMNFLLSDDFKPVVNEMKNLKVNDFTNDTKAKVQKTINQIKASQRIEQSKKAEKKSSSKTVAEQSKNTTCNQLTLPTNANSNGRSTCSLKKVNQSESKQCITPYSYMSRNESSKSKYLSAQNTNRPFKINYDKYIFNHSFQKKMKFLNAKIEKEYKFQKGLLKNKKNELIVLKNYDIEKSKKEADFFYKSKLIQEMRKLKDKEKTAKLNETFKPHLSIFNRLKYNYENKLCKSLNHNLIEPYTTFLKTKHSKQPEHLKKDLSLDKNDDSFIENLNEVPNINKTYINKFEYDIENINKKEIKVWRDIHNGIRNSGTIKSNKTSTSLKKYKIKK